ncbi:MAG: HAMP domain-containing sensor histidine kinase [Chitinophagales bacterium]
MNFVRKHKILLGLLTGIILLGVGLTIDIVQSVSPNINRAKHILEKRIHKLEAKADKIISNPVLYNANVSYDVIKNYIDNSTATEKFFIYVYRDGVLKYWSNNSFIPENIDKLNENKIFFLKEANSFFDVLHQSSDDDRVKVYAFIPVYYQFNINNKFLNNGFVFNHPFLKRIIISSKEVKKTTSVNDKDGHYLFSIRIADNAKFVYNPYIILVEFIGLIFLFWALYQIIKNLFLQRKNRFAVSILLLVIIAAEILLNQLDVLSITQSSLLFSSSLFASNILGKTLGTLLIRTFLIAWSLSYLKYIPLPNKDEKRNDWIIIFPVILFFLIIYTIQSVIKNSVISFDFYLVNSLDKYTFVSLLIFGLLFASLLFLLKWIFDQTISKNYLLWTLCSSVACILFGYWIKEIVNFNYALFLCLWIFTFIIFFHYEKILYAKNPKYRFLSNLILVSLIAFLTSVIIIHNTNQKEIDKRKYRMEELISERDAGEEYNLTEAEKQIKNDAFIKAYFKNPYLYNIDIDNRITGKYFKRFQKRYTINTYTFDKDGVPLVGAVQKDFNKLNSYHYYKKAKTISPNFQYLSIKENGEKYLGYFPLKEDTVNLGYLFVEFIPKIFSSYSAYPELLINQKNYYDEEFENFSYGIYDNNFLVKQKGDYEYKLKFDYKKKNNNDYNVYKTANYTHLVYFGNEKQVVLSEKNRPVLSTFSVFSYMVIFFLFFFILIDWVGFSDRFWSENAIKDFFSGNTLQKQIQNAMIALVLFSLAVIGIVTLVYFQYQYNIYHNSRLLKKVNAVMKNVSQYYVDDYPTYGENTFDKVIQQRVKTLSNIHALDINVYNTKGDLIQSSQPEIFKQNLVSKKIDENAYYNLFIKSKSKYVHDEHIGKLEFLSAYQPFRSNGKVLGYFNFPYYGKQKSFREDISYFLVALVNVYVLFLIAAALLAVFLSRSITNSLTLISDNIRNVQFGKKNQEIKWKNDDEIGLLVKQYNLMLAELEKSAELLGKSEREGAWREMAKQVAHEIKNPLTPMKLSIQHLQRALNDDAEDVKELTQKISVRLIEQIDNLSNIATAFSDFAKMPQGNFDVINIEPILKSAVELFREIEHLEINLNYDVKEYFVNGDKEQLMRVFINIIKNATQAIPESKTGLIDINIEEKDEQYIISFKDNGTGIPEEKREHIFEPNFTTKNSGTGLGLAICKNIIERMNGKIWFDSIVNESSVFYIELPKIKN